MGNKKDGLTTRREFLGRSAVAAGGLILGQSGLITGATSLITPSANAAPTVPMWVPGTSISFVQTANVNYSYPGAPANTSITLPANVTVGNTVVVSWHSRAAGSNPDTCTGLGNATNWNQIVNFTGNSSSTYLSIWNYTCTVAGNTISFAVSGGIQDAIAIFATEFSGMANVPDDAQTGTAGSGIVLAATNATFVSYQPELLYYAGVSNSTSTITAGPTNGFTSLGLQSLAYPHAATKMTGSAAYRLVQASSHYTTSTTYSSNNIWSAALVSIK